MNWFLKMIGMQSVVDEVQARADRQVEALQDEIDILEGRINLTKGELIGQIGGLRGQVATLLDHVTNPTPGSNGDTDPEFRTMITALLSALDEDIRSFHRRISALETVDATESAVGERLTAEVDDNGVEIAKLQDKLSTLEDELSVLGNDFSLYAEDYQRLVNTYNTHVRRLGSPHTSANSRPAIHDTFE